MFDMHVVRRWIGIFLVLILLPFSALASDIYYGTVVCDAATTVLAPFGGIVSNLSVRKGSLIRKGDIICAIETKRVYSPIDGTVSAVFGDIGDSVEEVKNRRGGVIYIIPASRYTATASINDGNKNPDNYISIGQTVWLQKGSRKTAAGTGIITSITTEGENAGNYTVEIDTGFFSQDEKINIYEREKFDKGTLLGLGTVSQTLPFIINGEGSILRVYVKPGSEVSRGSLLFETVTGDLEGIKSSDNRVSAMFDGIIASVEAANGTSVEQNSPLITVYPLDDMRVCISVPETNLTLFPKGQTVNLTFNSDDVRTGTVESIDYLADVNENSSPSVGFANYKVNISFNQKDNIRQGMFVTVELPVSEEEEE